MNSSVDMLHASATIDRAEPARRRDYPLKARRVWRPDSRLQQDLGDKLAVILHAEIGKVRYRVNFGSVVLMGDVEDPTVAQLAHVAAQSVWGVQGVRNEIRHPLRPAGAARAVPSHEAAH